VRCAQVSIVCARPLVHFLCSSYYSFVAVTLDGHDLDIPAHVRVHVLVPFGSRADQAAEPAREATRRLPRTMRDKPPSIGGHGVIKVDTFSRTQTRSARATCIAPNREFAALVDGIQAIPDNTDNTLLAELTYAVPTKVARAALGNKARSEIYEAAARGDLDLVKDGHKTLVTVASIRSYQAKWPRITVKPAAAGRRKQSRQARELDAR
jgi:hypothetical protein